MPARGLPGKASLEQLGQGAEAFQRAVRAGDAGAAEVVREFHPQLGAAAAGSAELNAFSLADAQLVVARRFGFPRWDELSAYLKLVGPYSRCPHDYPIGGPIADEDALVDEFLALACLTYGNDDPVRWRRARELLDANPQLAAASIHAAAAASDVTATRALLERDPSQVGVKGGPHGWEPLVYLTYSRLPPAGPGHPALDVAALLLQRGADPNAGYLWEGLSPPFTALTGVFGRGEGDPPPHPDWESLARLLLEAGADPNDEQTLYNRQWDPDDTWLELLFEYGLGTGDGGPWHRLLVAVHATPAAMLEDQLMAAAHHGFASRVRLLLDHGVDPDRPETPHPIYDGRTPMQEAALWGYPEIVRLLRDAGATSPLTELDEFLAVCTAADHGLTERMIDADPTLPVRAIADRPDQLVRAAEKNSLQAVVLLIDLGFDANARNRTAPLHEAARWGNLDMIELLIDHGADPNIRDSSYDATPAGWAGHFGQTEAERYLRRLEG